MYKTSPFFYSVLSYKLQPAHAYTQGWDGIHGPSHSFHFHLTLYKKTSLLLNYGRIHSTCLSPSVWHSILKIVRKSLLLLIPTDSCNDECEETF